MAMFEIGREYTREDIHEEVGGSKQSYLPTKGGMVVAVCVKQRLNEEAPRVVVCGSGPLIESAGKLLSTQSHAVPVFLKQAVNRWEYQGLFKSAVSYTSGLEFEQHVAKSGRAMGDVSRVVTLVPADAAADAATRQFERPE